MAGKVCAWVIHLWARWHWLHWRSSVWCAWGSFFQLHIFVVWHLRRFITLNLVTLTNAFLWSGHNSFPCSSNKHTQLKHAIEARYAFCSNDVNIGNDNACILIEVLHQCAADPTHDESTILLNPNYADPQWWTYLAMLIWSWICSMPVIQGLHVYHVCLILCIRIAIHLLLYSHFPLWLVRHWKPCWGVHLVWAQPQSCILYTACICLPSYHILLS